MDILVDHVSKTFGEKRVLSDISLNIRSGQVYGLIGPNGAGKTTLTRTIMDIYRPSSGAVYIDGVQTSQAEFNAIRSKIGCVMDQLGLYKNLTAWENLEFFHRIYYPRAHKRIRSEEIAASLDLVGLTEHGTKKVTFFSRGMRQRLALARAFINRPQLLILDEPNRGLDVEGNYMLRKYIEKVKKKGITVLINSHQLEEMKKICDIYGFINKGKLVEEGTFEELINKYQPHLGMEQNLESIYREIFQVKTEENEQDFVVG